VGCMDEAGDGEADAEEVVRYFRDSQTPDQRHKPAHLVLLGAQLSRGELGWANIGSKKNNTGNRSTVGVHGKLAA
jgi:hypothetical protein